MSFILSEKEIFSFVVENMNIIIKYGTDDNIIKPHPVVSQRQCHARIGMLSVVDYCSSQDYFLFKKIIMRKCCVDNLVGLNYVEIFFIRWVLVLHSEFQSTLSLHSGFNS